MRSNQLPDHVRTQALTHFRHNYMLFTAQHQTPSRGCLTLLDALIITGQWVSIYDTPWFNGRKMMEFYVHPLFFLKCSLNNKSM